MNRVRCVLGQRPLDAGPRWRPLVVCALSIPLAIGFVNANMRSTPAMSTSDRAQENAGSRTTEDTEQTLAVNAEVEALPTEPADAPRAEVEPVVDSGLLRELGFAESAHGNKVLIEALTERFGQPNEPSELEIALRQLDPPGAEEPPAAEEVERLAAELAGRFAKPQQRGRIYAKVAHVLHQRRRWPRTILWTYTAMKYPLEPLMRLQLYQVWAEAAAGQDEAARQSGANQARCNTTLPAILGLLEAARYELPLEAPKLPDGGEPSRRVAADYVGTMITLRDRLADELAARLIRPIARQSVISTILKRASGSGFLLDTNQPQRPNWVPHGVATYASFSVRPKKFVDTLEAVFDAIFGDGEAVFEETIESIRTDPYGPRIDFRREIFDNLSGRITVLTDYSHPNTPYGQRILFAAEVRDADAMADTIDRMMQSEQNARRGVEREPTAKLTQRNGINIWSNESDDDTIASEIVCVAHNHLFIASDVALLEKIIPADR